MGKALVTVRGSGQLGGVVRINKTVEMDERMASKFNGGNRNEVITEFLKVHYPGVKIKPNQIFVNVVYKKDKPVKKSKEKSISSTLVGSIANKLSSNKTKINSGSLVKTAVGTIAGGSIAGGIVNALFDESETEAEKSERLRQERYIDDLDQSVKEKTEYIEYLKIPNNSEELTDLLDDLTYKLKSNKWKPIIGANDEDEAKLMNKLMDAYVTKYSMGIKKLERLGIADNVLNEYKTELKKINKRKFFGKFSYILILIGFIILLGVSSLIFDK